MVEDCCCDYETVNKLNTEVLHPLLQDLVKTPFYRYFKVWVPLHLLEIGYRVLEVSVLVSSESVFVG